MKRVLIVGLLAAAIAAMVGCEAGQQRDWTVKASRLETVLINSSEFMPTDQKLTDAQIDAFGAARVDFYTKYGQYAKDAIEQLKKDK